MTQGEFGSWVIIQRDNPIKQNKGRDPLLECTKKRNRKTKINNRQKL
jgi:hypothetical protein